MYRDTGKRDAGVLQQRGAESAGDPGADRGLPEDQRSGEGGGVGRAVLDTEADGGCMGRQIFQILRKIKRRVGRYGRRGVILRRRFGADTVFQA